MDRNNTVWRVQSAAMSRDGGTQDDLLQRLDERLHELPSMDAALDEARLRARADLAALAFHAGYRDAPPLIAIIGGTGTGKSTLLNRLVGQTVSGTSYRRTYTAGPIAVVAPQATLPSGWLGIPHEKAAEVPARGRPEALVVVECAHPVAPAVLIDTPDIDGDEPAHQKAADRVFRWCTGAVFVVTPEKYQMTELLPYYRLARRYGLAAWFIMNKTEHPEAVEDYRAQLAERDWPEAAVYVIERDDATYAPQAAQSLDALRQALADATVPADPAGLANRKRDLVTRLLDQVVAPLRERRRQAERIIAALRAMEQPQPNVDVNPLTEQLRVRLQQRSILYLIGPKRMWDRVRQAPGLLLRMPRSLWMLARGRKVELPEPEVMPTTPGDAPDFAAALAEQFVVVQSRIDDVLRSDPAVAGWMDDAQRQYSQTRLDSRQAAVIAEEEIADLQQWLQQRWDTHPRDTLLVMKVLRYLPGGARVTRAVEAAPYLLLLFFLVHPGHVLHEVLFGVGYAAVAGLIERLSNEVAARTRATNRRIGERFAELAHQQIDRVVDWLERQSAPKKTLDEIERLVEQLDTARG